MTLLHVFARIGYLTAVALLWAWAVIGSLLIVGVAVGTVAEWWQHRRVARDVQKVHQLAEQLLRDAEATR